MVETLRKSTPGRSVAPDRNRVSTTTFVIRTLGGSHRMLTPMLAAWRPRDDHTVSEPSTNAAAVLTGGVRLMCAVIRCGIQWNIGRTARPVVFIFRKQLSMIHIPL